MQLDKVDNLLRDWIGTVFESVEVSFSPPNESSPSSPSGVSLYLMELVNAPPARGTERAPLQMAARYLITTWATKPEEAHRMLGILVFAAMENTQENLQWEVQLDPVTVDVWRAFGTKPQPSFFLQTPISLIRPVKPAKRVKFPLETEFEPIGNLYGCVVTGMEGAEKPIMNAQVRLPLLNRSTVTDKQGRFHFAAVPAGPKPKMLRVKVKKHEISMPAKGGEQESEPVIIRIPEDEV